MRGETLILHLSSIPRGPKFHESTSFFPPQIGAPFAEAIDAWNPRNPSPEKASPFSNETDVFLDGNDPPLGEGEERRDEQRRIVSRRAENTLRNNSGSLPRQA